MSLYNLVHGQNPLAALVLGALGNPSVPRYRDAWLEDGRLAIHTRTGGGNRSYYDHPDRHRRENEDSEYEGPFNSDLRAIHGFLYDEDDDFDCTYATFYFSIPDEWASLFQTLGEIGAKKIERPAEAWARVLSELHGGAKTEQSRRIIEGLAPVMTAISDAFADPTP